MLKKQKNQQEFVDNIQKIEQEYEEKLIESEECNVDHMSDSELQCLMNLISLDNNTESKVTNN